MTIIVASNNFNATIYSKYRCVPIFVPNKPSLNHLYEKGPKMLKKPLKSNLARHLKHITLFFILTILPQYYIPNSVVRQDSYQTNQV